MNGLALLRFRTRVQAVMESFQPCTVIINGSAPLVAATSGLRRQGAQNSRGGGFDDEDDIKFRIRKDLLPAAPAPYQGRIAWVEKSIAFKIGNVADAGPNDCAWLIGGEATNE